MQRFKYTYLCNNCTILKARSIERTTTVGTGAIRRIGVYKQRLCHFVSYRGHPLLYTTKLQNHEEEFVRAFHDTGKNGVSKSEIAVA